MEGWREGRLRFSRKCRLRHISRGKKVKKRKSVIEVVFKFTGCQDPKRVNSTLMPSLTPGC